MNDLSEISCFVPLPNADSKKSSVNRYTFALTPLVIKALYHNTEHLIFKSVMNSAEARSLVLKFFEITSKVMEQQHLGWVWTAGRKAIEEKPSD